MGEDEKWLKLANFRVVIESNSKLWIFISPRDVW